MNKQSKGRKRNAARPSSEAVGSPDGGKEAVRQETFSPGGHAPDPNRLLGTGNQTTPGMGGGTSAGR
jgi:hypothetical protein